MAHAARGAALLMGLVKYYLDDHLLDDHLWGLWSPFSVYFSSLDEAPAAAWPVMEHSQMGLADLQVSPAYSRGMNPNL